MKEGVSEGVKKRRKERGMEGEERMKGGRNTTLWGFFSLPARVGHKALLAGHTAAFTVIII